jgi:integrase/recombinase XerD
MKLEDAINCYVRRKQATGISFSKGCSLFRTFLKVVGNLQLCQITVKQVAEFLDQSQASATTFRAKHSLFVHFFEYWVAHGEITKPPMPPNRPPQRSTFLPYVFTKEELHRLLSLAPACRTSRDKIHPKTLRTILLMLYATGATTGEVIRLRVASVDLRNGILKMPGCQLKAGRSIPIGKDLNRVIWQYIQRRERAGNQSDRFFSRIDGGVIDSTAIHRHFARLCRRAGIAGFRGSSRKPCVRDLRSTFAVHQITAWIKKKENLDVMLPALAAYMGNSGLASTERYLRLTPARFQNTLNKLSPATKHARWRDDLKLLEFLSGL